ncbi:MAG TPA: hypothetical protein VH878_05680 [Thermodesulfobacteriota bacterium]|jgi:hypothetical protein
MRSYRKLDFTIKKRQYTLILASLFLAFILITMTVATRSQEAAENPATETHGAEDPGLLTVINEYFEIIAVFLEMAVVVLLYKTVKDFAELAKVSKLQTQVRFRPWVGPSGGFEFLRDDNDKKQYSIAMKNFGEVPSTNVIVTSVISDTKPDKSSALEGSKQDGASEFHIGPLLPGMEKRYWVFIDNERYRNTMEGSSNLFVFVYFSYFYSGGKSGYGMISQLDSKTNNFVHREMWID